LFAKSASPRDSNRSYSAADSTWVGLLSGVAVGVLLGAFLGVMSIRYRVDQIIGGTVINFFALGMTSYLTARVLVEYPSLNEPGSFRAFGIPGLDRIGIGGIDPDQAPASIATPSSSVVKDTV